MGTPTKPIDAACQHHDQQSGKIGADWMASGKDDDSHFMGGAENSSFSVSDIYGSLATAGERHNNDADIDLSLFTIRRTVYLHLCDERCRQTLNSLFQPPMANALTNAFSFLNSQGIIPTINGGYRSPANQARRQNGGSAPNPGARVSWHQVGMAVHINGTSSSLFPDD